MKIELTVDDILKDSTVYLTVKDITGLTGLSKSTIHNHIHKGLIDCYEFRSKTFFTPEQADRYKRLSEAGVLGREA